MRFVRALADDRRVVFTADSGNRAGPTGFGVQAMDGSYDFWRVTLSIGVAVLASYVAFRVVSVFAARRADRLAKLAESLKNANVDLAAHSAELAQINERLRKEARERAWA